MRHNKDISTLEILEQYPYSAYFQSIEELDLEHVSKLFEKDYGIRIESLDKDYIHVYNNYIIVLTSYENGITMLVFSKKENVSDEVIQFRRKMFDDFLESLN
jgi:protein involved in ribonucleotide reduction